MINYTVYFEIFGKRMKTTVLAETEDKAIEIVKKKLTIHKVEKTKNDAFNEVTDMFDNLFKNGKK